MSLKIGDVSKLLSMSPETIRYYESEKIISPTRNKIANTDDMSRGIYFI